MSWSGVQFTCRNGTVYITGDTYQLREDIKSLFGARWNATERAWVTVMSLQDIGSVVNPGHPEYSQVLHDYINEIRTLPLTKGYIRSMEITCRPSTEYYGNTYYGDGRLRIRCSDDPEVARLAQLRLAGKYSWTFKDNYD